MSALTKSLRVIVATSGLVAALTSTLAGQVAAHGTIYSGTDAYCGTYQISAIAGTSYRYINGAFPTGVTTGATYLAARVETNKRTFSYVTWSTGSQWVKTNINNFPYGLFLFGSTWNRRAEIAFNEPWLDTSLQARIAWQVLWPDGHRTMAYTKWVYCY